MPDNPRARAFIENLPLVKMEPDELAHYGVLGMHWGYRKPESVAREAREDRHINNTRRKLAVGTLGASVAAPKVVAAVKKRRLETGKTKVQFEDVDSGKRTNKKYPISSAPDHVRSRELLQKKNHQLSNAEIDKIVARLQKEQKLKQLNPPASKKAKNAVIAAVAALGTATTIYSFGTSPLGKRTIGAGWTAFAASPQGQKAIANGARIVKAIALRRIA